MSRFNAARPRLLQTFWCAIHYWARSDDATRLGGALLQLDMQRPSKRHETKATGRILCAAGTALLQGNASSLREEASWVPGRWGKSPACFQDSRPVVSSREEPASDVPLTTGIKRVWGAPLWRNGGLLRGVFTGVMPPVSEGLPGRGRLCPLICSTPSLFLFNVRILVPQRMYEWLMRRQSRHPRKKHQRCM